MRSLRSKISRDVQNRRLGVFTQPSTPRPIEQGLKALGGGTIIILARKLDVSVGCAHIFGVLPRVT